MNLKAFTRQIKKFLSFQHYSKIVICIVGEMRRQHLLKRMLKLKQTNCQVRLNQLNVKKTFHHCFVGHDHAADHIFVGMPEGKQKL